jgi:hypothetical protein
LARRLMTGSEFLVGSHHVDGLNRLVLIDPFPGMEDTMTAGMKSVRYVCLLLVALTYAITVSIAVVSPGAARAEGRPQTAPEKAAPSSLTWVGRATEIEEYLRTAPVVRYEKTKRGVTQPSRAYLAPGGPVDSMLWKVLPPRMSRGYFESYKSEIAAYQIDQLLGLNMVPPKVERRLEGNVGVAIMWAESTRSFADLGGVPTPPPAHAQTWNRQIIRAKMFQNLIGDIDPNLGNWLVDPAWNLILVDHSRALTTTKKLVHKMQQVDAALGDRMQGLTADSLTTACGDWLDAAAVGAVLERRDQLRREIDKLVRDKSAAQVFVR